MVQDLGAGASVEAAEGDAAAGKVTASAARVPTTEVVNLVIGCSETSSRPDPDDRGVLGILGTDSGVLWEYNVIRAFAGGVATRK